MIDRLKYTGLLLALMATSVAAAEDTANAQHIIWDKTPIALQLSIDSERRLQFRAPVSVGVPAALNSVLRTQTVNSTVYFQAHRSFPKTRILVRELDGGQVYLFDIAAHSANTEQRPVVIHLPQVSSVVPNPGGTSRTPSYVALTRFAAQQLYAPARLLEAVPGIRRVPVPSAPFALLLGSTVQATPLIGWRAGDLHVTAVKLVNQGHRPVTLDPRKLRGNWLSATFQHARLLRAGGDADTTAVYLVSSQAFAEAQ